MARSDTASISYFPLDTDFSRDIKIKKIKARFGFIGKAIIIELYSQIYASNGYYMPWDLETAELLAMDESIELYLIEEVIQRALELKIFDLNLYERYSILTSKRIQSTYIEATKSKKEVDIFQDYLLIRKKDLFKCIVRKDHTVNILEQNNEIIETLDFSMKENFNDKIDEKDELQEEDGEIEEKTSDEQNDDRLLRNKSVIEGEKSVKNAQRKGKENKGNESKLNNNIYSKNTVERFQEILSLFPKGKTRSPDTELKFLKSKFKNWEDKLPMLETAIIAQNKKRSHDALLTGKNQDTYAKEFKNWIESKEYEKLPEIPEDKTDGYVKWKGNPTNELPEDVQKKYDEIENMDYS